MREKDNSSGRGSQTASNNSTSTISLNNLQNGNKNKSPTPTNISAPTNRFTVKKELNPVNKFKYSMNSPLANKTINKPTQKLLNKVTSRAIKAVTINSRSYSSSFCQPNYNSNPKEKIKIKITEEEDKPPKRANTNKKMENYIKQGNLNFNPISNQINEDTINEGENKTKKFLNIFDKFKKLIDNSRKDFTDLKILTDFEEINGEITDIYQEMMRNKKSEEQEQENKEIEEIEENEENQTTPTKEKEKENPTEEKKSKTAEDSERRKNIYKRFFDICKESVEDISGMLNVPIQITNNIITNMPINIDRRVTTNVTNNQQKTKNNTVQVNVNLNVKNIKNIRHKATKSVKRTVSHKIKEESDDSYDLSESQTCEGISNKVPIKNYMVNKPKDDWVNYRLYTDGDDGEAESRFERRQKAFAKTRSKSQININTKNTLTVAFDFCNVKTINEDEGDENRLIMEDVNVIDSEDSDEEHSLDDDSDGSNDNGDELSKRPSQDKNELNYFRKISEDYVKNNMSNSKDNPLDKLDERHSSKECLPPEGQSRTLDNSNEGASQKGRRSNKCLIF